MKKSFFLGASFTLGIFVVYLAFSVISGILTPADETDPGDGGMSGLKLFTDHGTGCQYLQHGTFGSLTPRLDATGKPMCRNKPSTPQVKVI